MDVQFTSINLMYSLSNNMSKNLKSAGGHVKRPGWMVRQNGSKDERSGEYRIRTDDPLRARQVL